MKNALLLAVLLGFAPLSSFANDDYDSEEQHVEMEDHQMPEEAAPAPAHAEKKQEMKKTHAAAKKHTCKGLKGKALAQCQKKAH